MIHDLHELWFSSLVEDEWAKVLILDVGMGQADIDKTVRAVIDYKEQELPE